MSSNIHPQETKATSTTPLPIMSSTSRDSDESPHPETELDLEKQADTNLTSQRQTTPMNSSNKPLDGPVDSETPNITENNKGTDWNGPDDPENTLNWSGFLRYWHVVPAALVSFSA